MQPIYMPFTHISEYIAGRIHDLLGKIMIYQPGGLPIPSGLNYLAEKGIIHIRNPIEVADGDILAGLKHDYDSWANRQTSRSMKDTSGFMAAVDSIPFYEESSSARIRTEINQLRRGESVKPEKDSILAARLFLALAQEHDARKNDVVQDLSAIDVIEKRLLESLKGDETETLEGSPIQMAYFEDMGGYMTRKRIDSWSTLFMADNMPPDIFVTDSRAVVAQLCDTADDLVAISGVDRLLTNSEKHSDNLKIFRHILQDTLIQLGQSNDPFTLIEKKYQKEGDLNKVPPNQKNWSLYLAPGISPDLFWGRYADRDKSIPSDLMKKSKMLNTLVFHLEL